ncbi:MAG: MDR family MFS transporter [Bacteroidales bacterium]
MTNFKNLQNKIQQSKLYRWWVLLIVLLSTFMAILDVTVVNVGMPAIMQSFGIDISKAEWVVTSYLVTMTLMLVVSGWLADKFGVKRIYLLGLSIFTLGSFLCGRAENEFSLILFRAFQGIGGGMVQALGLAIVSREFPPKERGIALGFWAAAAAASISFGPLVGGYLVDDANWHYIFDLNIPLGILAVLLAWVIQKEWEKPNIGPFDTLGFICAIVFLPLTIFALGQGNASSNPLGWESPLVIGTFIIAGLAFIGFILRELNTQTPLLNIRLLKDRTFGISMLIVFLFSIGMFGVSFLLPLFLENGLGYTAIMVGGLFLPVGIIQGILGPVSGLITRRIGYLSLIIPGISIMIVSLFMASQFDLETSYRTISISLYLRGLGMGLTFAPISSMALSHIPNEEMSSASGIATTFKQLSGSISIALLTTIMSARIHYHHSCTSLSSNEASVNLANKIATMEGITDAFKVTTGILILAGFCLLFLIKLPKKQSPIK